MNTANNGDWLDRVLRENTGHIDDGGFTDAVMMQLPPRRQQNRRRNVAILAGAAALSGAVVLVSLPDQGVLYKQVSELLLTRPILGLGLFSLALSTVAGLIAGWMLNIER